MAKCETVLVKRKSDGLEVLINKEDFNSELHTQTRRRLEKQEDPPEESGQEVFYADLNVNDLKEELRNREMAVSGTREELIARLKAADDAAAATDGE